MNKKLQNVLILNVFIIILAAACWFIFLGNKAENKHTMTEFSVEKLKKVPAYRIVYKNDYKFNEYLQTGVKDDSELYKFLEESGLHPHKNMCSIDDSTYGCTCFTVKNQKEEVFFGRNFDWYSHSCALVYTDPSDAYSSVSMVDLYYAGVYKGFGHDDSVYDNKNMLSLPYIPLDGINECGVAIGVMSLPVAEAPKNSDKKTISSMGAVRLVLDYAANVDEAVELLGKYNIYFQKVPIHYMISDNTGKSVIIEYVEGKMNVIENEQSWQVSTNFVLSGYDNTGRGRDRYDTAEKQLSTGHDIVEKSAAMDILKDTSQFGATIWSIVYDLNNLEFDLCVGRRYNKVYSSGLR